MTTFAFAGAGWMARVHALALKEAGTRVGRLQLKAVASRTPERARDLAGSTGRAISMADLPADADIVVVATPAGEHLIPTLRAAAGGAAVLVEKPMCTTLADADRIVRVAEAGAAITYAENLLFAPAVVRAMREIASLGTLGHLSVKIAQGAPTWGNFLQRAAGGGVVLDLGSHAIALVLRALSTDTPTGVRAVLEVPDGAEVEDRGHVTIEFSSGLSASVDVSWRESTPDWHLQAAAEHGVVHLELLPDLRLEKSGEPIELEPIIDVGLPSAKTSPGPDADTRLRDFGYVDQICEVVYARRAERGVAASPATFGRRVLDIVCAASASAANGGEAVPLPFAGARDVTPIEMLRPGQR